MWYGILACLCLCLRAGGVVVVVERGRRSGEGFVDFMF